MIDDIFAVFTLLAVVVGGTMLLAYLERPEHGPRYSGRTYDPAPRPVKRAGAVRVGNNGTGRECVACGAVTFGHSPRCGRCGYENTALTRLSTHLARPSLLASEVLPSPQVPDLTPCDDLAATVTTLTVPSSLSPAATPKSRGTRRRSGGSLS